MIEDQFIHDSKGDLERDHISSADCWCEPIRERWNPLSQVWEVWDRETLTWSIRNGEIPPETVVPRADLEEPHPFSTISPESEQAEREAMRTEDEFWKRVD
jgi:hypothetical protein